VDFLHLELAAYPSMYQRKQLNIVWFVGSSSFLAAHVRFLSEFRSLSFCRLFQVPIFVWINKGCSCS
jgi:hypothetical protein